MNRSLYNSDFAMSHTMTSKKTEIWLVPGQFTSSESSL